MLARDHCLLIVADSVKIHNGRNISQCMSNGLRERMSDRLSELSSNRMPDRLTKSGYLFAFYQMSPVGFAFHLICLWFFLTSTTSTVLQEAKTVVRS